MRKAVCYDRAHFGSWPYDGEYEYGHRVKDLPYGQWILAFRTQLRYIEG